MKKILIAAGAAALLLNNEIFTMAILTVAAACAVAALFSAVGDGGKGIWHACNPPDEKILRGENPGL